MRKIVLGFAMSLDGYIARPDGAVDFLVMDKETSELMAKFFATIDTAIMGRKTIEAAIRMTGGSYKPPVPLATYVFSRTWAVGKRDHFEVVRQSPAALIRKLRKLPGKNIFLMGGGELARSFLQADLVDELFLSIVPVLLGEGIPAFPGGFPQRAFKLLGSSTSSKHSVTLSYRRIRPKAKRQS
jgi:dihydrofolate reductase